MATIHVNTTNGTPVPAGFVSIDANARGKDIADSQRYRNINIPELSFPDVPSKFVTVMADAFYKLAKARFTETMKDEGRDTVRTVDSSDYTIPALLEYFEQVAESNRLTKDAIVEWFNSSATAASILATRGEKIQTNWRDTLSKLASPNSGINSEQAGKLLAGIKHEDQDTVGANIVRRLNTIINKAVDATEL